MEPSRRTFPARNMATTEAALMRRGASQLYLSLGDPNPDGTVPVRLYFKPQVLMIWLGALFMFAGGALVALRSAAADRRPEAIEGQERRYRLQSDSVRQFVVGAPVLRLIAGFFVVVSGAPLRAVEPIEMLADPTLEARARDPVEGIALHGVSKPVDRQIRSAARA